MASTAMQLCSEPKKKEKRYDLEIFCVFRTKLGEKKEGNKLHIALAIIGQVAKVIDFMLGKVPYIEFEIEINDIKVY